MHVLAMIRVVATMSLSQKTPFFRALEKKGAHGARSMRVVQTHLKSGFSKNANIICLCQNLPDSSKQGQ